MYDMPGDLFSHVLSSAQGFVLCSGFCSMDFPTSESITCIYLFGLSAKQVYRPPGLRGTAPSVKLVRKLLWKKL